MRQLNFVAVFSRSGRSGSKEALVSSPASWPLFSSPSFCLLNSSRIPFYYYYKNIVSVVLEKQNDVVHQGLFPFYFTFCFQSTWKHSRTAAPMHVQIIIIGMPHFQGLRFSSLLFLFFFRKRGTFWLLCRQSAYM